MALAGDLGALAEDLVSLAGDLVALAGDIQITKVVAQQFLCRKKTTIL